MIILIGSHKGGVGKSTQFINVLMCLLLKGKNVVPLECDDQRSVKMWLDERKEKCILSDPDYYECYTNIQETAKASLRGRRKHAGWDSDYMESLLFRKGKKIGRDFGA